jgi:SnoaL-like domain
MSRAFAEAIAARDADAVTKCLAPDVVVHSALTAAPFEGREMVADLYSGVLEAFDELRVVDEFEGEGTYAFFWEGRIDGRFVAGVDHVRRNSEGKVLEIKIFGRPMSGVATFLTGIGPRFARRRRGGLVAKVLRVTARPLPPLLASMDPVTRWVARGRSR